MDTYGPPLPPGFQKPETSDESSSDAGEKSVCTTKPSAIIGPRIPDHLIYKSCSDEKNLSLCIGPALPNEFQTVNDYDNSDSELSHSDEQSSTCIGPVLPKSFQKRNAEENSDSELSHSEEHSSICIGPVLPKSFQKRTEEENSDSELSHSEEQSVCIGPVLPKSFRNRNAEEENSDSELPGPRVPIDCNKNEDNNDVIAAIEKRAQSMKSKLEKGDEPEIECVKREEWMTVPDTSRRNQLGVISRCLAPGSKKAVSKEKEHYRHAEKDKKTSKELKKYNKSRRAKSLLEMHQKTRKKEEKKLPIPQERKPFDRDEMAVRQFTKSQVNSVIDKAKYLNSRFGAGASKYL